MNKIKLMILSLVVISFTVHADNSDKIFKDISTASAQTLLASRVDDADFTLLDVRTDQEYQEAHIKGSQLLDYYNPNFSQKLAALDKDKTYLVYCRSGNRSSKALSLMKKLGFTKVYNMQGGIVQWYKQDRPLLIN